ncbi:Tyrosine-protein phosphatase non-receptor type [Dirofilaria immitis]
MEGMPRVPMLTPDLKFCLAPLPKNFSSQLKEYILLHYQDDPMKYDEAISEIENMRSKLTQLLPNLETVSILKRYYAQLCLMKNRFPMEKGDAINIVFSWMEKNNDTSNAVIFEDINYELACVMYNIGAIHGAIAANELRIDLDSIKNAFTHFQCAAFPFEHIRDCMNAIKYSSLDFDSSVLTFYVTILLAQAQECLLEKSIIDHRKNTVIAKLAIHLRDVYMQCRNDFDFTTLSNIASEYKEWLRTCIIKSEIYGAIAMLHLGFQAEVDNKMGFRVSYFDFALEHVTAAMKQVEKDKRESLKEAVIFLNDIIFGKHRNAKKENDFIYHDRIPKPEELPVVEGVNMVKAVRFDPTDKSVAGPDLFAALLPGNVLKSLSIYSEEKAKFKRTLLEKIEQKDKELEDYIKSLQLEEINFDDDSKMEELPEMLLERSAAFNSQPDAFPELLDKLHRVGECAIEADHKMSNLRNRLDAISSSELRSDEGFIAIMKELNRVNDHHMKARTNNTELQRALAAHSESLKILAMPLNELRKRLTDTQTRPADSTEGLLLKKMLDKANEMSTQRRTLLAKLNDDLLNDDITAKCLTEKNEDNWGLYENELKKHEETATLINMNLAAQHNILSALTDANASFGDYRKKIIDENKNRMDQVLALTAAYDVYVDVSQKTEEGLKFYSTLFSMVKGLEEAVEAIENTFEEEKKEKEKEFLRGLEECATANAKWNKSGKIVKKEEEPISGGFENMRNESYKGLRLKDCLEYYRNNIAREMGTQPIRLPNGTQESHTVNTPIRNEISYNQTIPISDTAQFCDNLNSVPLRSHFASISNQSVSNISLSSIKKEIPQPYILHDNRTLSSHTSQASRLSGAHPQVATISSAPQHIMTSPYHFSRNHLGSTIQNHNAIHAPLIIANTQQVDTRLLPQTSLTHCISQPISATITAGSDRGQLMTAPQNVPTSSARLSMSAPLNYPPNIPCASTPALPEQSALTLRSESGLNTIAPIKIEGPIDGTILHPEVYDSPFAPNKMHSNFARSMMPNNTISTLAKSAVLPSRHLIYPQGTTFQTSPWHQPLRNVNDVSGLPTVDNTKMAYTSELTATTHFQSFVPNNQAVPSTTIPVIDIMNAPLDVILPTPLTPTHPTNEIESNNSSIEAITVHPSSTGSIKIEEMNLGQMPQLSESTGSLSCSSTIVQTPRPAAAVAPIMQTDCNITSTCDSTLCITNVTSMSYSAPMPQPKTTPLCTWQCTEKENTACNKGERNSNVKEVMDPQTFTIGNTDPIRLEKRYMREQFKTEGIGAQLPPLDPADPINCIDAHYWLNKS